MILHKKTRLQKQPGKGIMKHKNNQQASQVRGNPMTRVTIVDEIPAAYPLLAILQQRLKHGNIILLESWSPQHTFRVAWIFERNNLEFIADCYVLFGEVANENLSDYAEWLVTNWTANERGEATP